jgi:N-terminal acetyltransferase B complex catalytic subunit
MTSYRPFRPEDLFRTGLCNLDPLTENYDLYFYFQYLARWPDMFLVAEDPDGNIIGYS